jgi:protein ImuB
LPRWPIYRFLAAQAISPAGKPIDPERPFVLAIAATGGLRVAAMNEAAEHAGIAIGDPVADARAKADSLQVRGADSSEDAAALRRLTLWATRYTPTASPWTKATAAKATVAKATAAEENGADGFFLDIEGAAHLFGGEASLLADLAARLDRFGLPARLAVAANPGMAWALSHFHAAPQSILPSGEESGALAEMPVEALRLTSETRILLRRLGFKSVGTLIDKPRAPLAARFPEELLRRLDQALGHIYEPLVPVIAPPTYHSLNYLLEPIVSHDAIVALACRLMQTLVHALVRDEVGARALRLQLYGVDGTVETIDIGLTSPTRSVTHVARLIELKLEALTAMQDCGFGFEAIGLAVTRVEPKPPRQIETDIDHRPELRAQRASQGGDHVERSAALIDALRQRLGSDRVRQFEAVASHIPERAEKLTEIDGETFQFPPPVRGRVRVGGSGRQDDPSPDRLMLSGPPLSGEGDGPSAQDKPRPLLLLPQAEPAEVTALIPDGPPRRLRWRGVTYDIAGAQGPERIANEWWRAPQCFSFSQDQQSKQGGLTRDYYLVEDSRGYRFWLYREGLYGRETLAARWFVHGLFA